MLRSITHLVGISILVFSCKSTGPQDLASELQADQGGELAYGDFKVSRYTGQNSSDSRVSGGTISIIRAPIGARMDAMVTYLDRSGNEIRRFDIDYQIAYTECSQKCRAAGPNGPVSFKSLGSDKWIMEALSEDGIPYALNMTKAGSHTEPPTEPAGEANILAISAVRVKGIMEYVSGIGSSRAEATQRANEKAKIVFGNNIEPYVDSECVKKTRCIAIAQVKSNSGARACGIGKTVKEAAKAAQKLCKEAYGKSCASAFEVCQ
jgi:hypothetical protein